MSLQQRLTDSMKEAMKARDSLRLNTIRGIRTAIKNREIETGSSLDDDAVIGVISSLAKQRRESAQAYREGDRPELADKEEAELAVLQEFLPAQLSDDELRQMIAEVAAEVGAESPKDMGRVMKELTPKTRGRADGKRVSELVRAHLAG
ncbi:MAG: GatB/YqeY domain-containing protein [Geothermobacteraceae bacterium]